MHGIDTYDPYYEEKVKKYFKQDLDSIKKETSEIVSLVDGILEAEYNMLIEKTIKSRAILIQKCDNIFVDWKNHFKKELTETYSINYLEHSILDDDSYQSIPKRLEVYLNDTYDTEKRRIEVSYKYIDDELPIDYIKIHIFSNYY